MQEKDNNTKKYCVYEHVFPNGKRYIGISSSLKTRWASNGKGYRKQILVYRAIQKYGWNNIEHRILFENLSKTEAKQKEQELIKKYNLTDIQYGYNKTIGGEGGSLYETDEERLHARRISSKKYYDSHIEYYDQYRKEHDDIIKQRKHQYYIDHKEEILKKDKNLSFEQREIRKARLKQYYQNHKTEHYLYNKEWVKNNPEKNREYKKKYREKKKQEKHEVKNNGI